MKAISGCLLSTWRFSHKDKMDKIYTQRYAALSVYSAVFVIATKLEVSLGFPGGPVVKTMLPLQGTPFQSLVVELRSHMPSSMAKLNK